ncbi:MAG TPA: acyl-CoA dehydrogenase family protein [Pseudonocardia sp.]|nr:acyl-CoA dehydrogenase family protein [Pseudonocardia sp.]
MRSPSRASSLCRLGVLAAVQLFGGNGYMAEYRVEQLASDAKSLMIYAGSNEIQVTHIAKGLLA